MSGNRFMFKAICGSGSFPMLPDSRNWCGERGSSPRGTRWGPDGAQAGHPPAWAPEGNGGRLLNGCLVLSAVQLCVWLVVLGRAL